MNTPGKDRIPPQDQAALKTAQDLLLMQQSHRSHNEMVQECFMDCVKVFRSKALDSEEAGCVSKCAEKYMKLTRRAGFRFAEINLTKSPHEE